MIELNTLAVFLAACLAVNISPGPSIVYVSTMAISRGCRAGVFSAFGLSLGILGHVFASAFGVSIVLAKSAVAFTIIKYVGAAYLVYLGVTMLFAGKARTAVPDHPANGGLIGILLRSALVDVLNPKVAFFFLAFLPQFVDQNVGAVFSQTLVLGTVFVISGTIVDVAVAIFASRTVRYMRSSNLVRLTRWLPGSVLIALGIRLATLER